MHVRSLLATALAAVLAAPAPASSAPLKGTYAQAQPASQPAAASGAQAPSFGGWIGGEWGDLDGIQLRGDLELPVQKLTPQVGLSFVGALGFSHLDERGFDVDILKAVPAARFTLPVTPELSLFGDAGLGLYWAFAEGDDELSLLMRFAAGGLYAVNPRTKVGVQLVIDPMFGDYDDTTVALLVGLTFRP